MSSSGGEPPASSGATPSGGSQREPLNIAALVGRLPDSPLLPGLVAFAAAVVFVLLRLALVAHFDPSRFVFAGTTYVNPALAPAGLHVFPGTGYDGQFYYRLALDPADLANVAHGIRLDSGFRLERIGYPALAWLFSFGSAAAVPSVLIALNVVGLGLLGVLGGVAARDGGRHAIYGLLLAGYFGFTLTLGRDLTEIVAACFAVAGLLALRRRRPVLAGLGLAAAALTKETTIVIAVAFALTRIVALARRRARPGRDDLAWVIPGIAFTGWQGVIEGVTGHFTLREDTNGNLGHRPFVAMAHAIAHFVALLPHATADLWVAELAVLVIVAGFALWSMRSTQAPVHERVAWLLVLVLLASLSSDVWSGTADFRGLDDLFVLSGLILLGSKKRLAVPAALALVALVVVAAHRVVRL